MLIYALADGSLTRVLKTDAEIKQYGPPDEYAEVLELDPATNPLIVRRIDTSWNDTRLIGGVLTYKGSVIAINPPGDEWLAVERERGSESVAASIPSWATWTEAEAAAWYNANVTALVSAIPDITAMTQTAFNNNAKAICAQFQDIIAAQATVIRNLARMVIALRNKTWPNLEQQ